MRGEDACENFLQVRGDVPVRDRVFLCRIALEVEEFCADILECRAVMDRNAPGILQRVDTHQGHPLGEIERPHQRCGTDLVRCE